MWKENSLEPENWDDLKECGKKMLEEIFSYVEVIGEEKAWWPLSEKDNKRYQECIPQSGQSLESTYQEYVETVLKKNAPMNIHPGFLGWVMGCGNPVGVLAEMLIAGMNSNVIGGMQVTCKIETEVIGWLKELFGFSENASGLLTSGCSQSNLLALTIARNQVDNECIQEDGIARMDKNMIFYASEERHHSIDKAIEVLGIGSKQLHLIPVNERYEMDTDALAERICKDIQEGQHPVGVIANIGTVNSGAVDDIKKIHEITSKYHLWLHIDGAFGAMAAITDSYQKLRNEISLADSLAFDLHKWMYIPYGVGCVIVKEEKKHYEAFSASSAYMEHQDIWFSDYGIELSRDFKALKIWMCLKTYGLERYKKLIDEDIQKARYLETLIQESKELELLSPVSLNIVCFRYKGNEADERKLNDWNKRILMILQFEGKVFPSETTLNGKYVIRASIVNYKCQKSYLQYLINRVIEIGNKLR